MPKKKIKMKRKKVRKTHTSTVQMKKSKGSGGLLLLLISLVSPNKTFNSTFQPDLAPNGKQTRRNWSSTEINQAKIYLLGGL